MFWVAGNVHQCILCSEINQMCGVWILVELGDDIKHSQLSQHFWQTADVDSVVSDVNIHR